MLSKKNQTKQKSKNTNPDTKDYRLYDSIQYKLDKYLFKTAKLNYTILGCIPEWQNSKVRRVISIRVRIMIFAGKEGIVFMKGHLGGFWGAGGVVLLDLGDGYICIHLMIIC